MRRILAFTATGVLCLPGVCAALPLWIGGGIYITQYELSTGAPTGVRIPRVNPGTSSTLGDITAGPDGRLYVTESFSDGPSASTGTRVRVFDGVSGAPLGQFSPIPPATGSIARNSAGGIEFGPDGNLYVASSQSNQPDTTGVVRIDGASGQSLGMAVADPDPGFVHDIAFGPDGDLYYTNDSVVRRFDQSSGSITSLGIGSRLPEGITFGPDGRLYVASPLDNNVLVSNADGSGVSVFIAPGANGVGSPSDVTVAPDGTLLVCGSIGGFGRVWRYRVDGSFLGQLFITQDSSASRMVIIPEPSVASLVVLSVLVALRRVRDGL